MNFVEIEHVGGATKFEHHVVRDVDQCRNRTLTTALKTLLHPLRRFGLGVQTTNDATRKTSAQIRRSNLYRHNLIMIHCDWLEGWHR